MIQDKIKDIRDLKRIITGLKEEKRSVVFTNGCFDILHAGHCALLEEAKGHADVLVVAINSDESARRLKGGGRPIANQDDRMKVLASLGSVDFVTTFDEDDPGAIIRELDPDVIVKGSDWKEADIIGGDYIKKRGGRVVTVPFLKGYSTSKLIERIKGVK